MRLLFVSRVSYLTSHTRCNLMDGLLMIRYLRLWRQFVITAFVREAEYRMNFVIGVGEGLAQLALAVISFLLLYRFTDQVAGWTQAEVLILVGVYRIVEGLINLQIAPNMQAISG